MAEWLSLAKEAFESSTSYIDSNYRADWNYSIRAFHSEHAPGSKYLSEEYKHRSRIYHPKTRSIIRKNEAAGAVALFSNMDVVDVTPGNPGNALNVASAACMKEILEYRLSKTIPSFPLVMGAIQDAQTTGTVCSYNYWEYQVKNGKKVKDKPCIQLRPIENIRIDAGADWLDPINTSPYIGDVIPMYVCDVKGMMKSKNDKTGDPVWKTYDDATILKARPDIIDSTRQARLNGQELPENKEAKLKHFDIVWVIRWIMRDSQGDDFVYYTLGTESLLSEVKPIDEVYFHGKRPYTMGCAIIETHKPLKSSMPVLIRPLQQAANTLGNQRFDNVQFVLNKRWLVARGRQVDTQSLVRNAPGGVTLTTDPKTDIVESNWADVTSSSYVEHDRINSELDDLAGNFSPGTRVANKAMNDTLGGSKLAMAGAGLMSDYMLRTIIETWWEPTLRQLVLLESAYETDEVILGVCADKAQLFPRFGISRMTDEMLSLGVNVTVNVGMGASNPTERFQKFMLATNAAIQLVASAPPNFNVQEGIKELYSNAGYRDGARFFNENVDPRLIKAMQIIQQLQSALNGKQMELQFQGQLEAAKLQSGERVKAAELEVDKGRISGDLAIRQAELAVEQQRIELEKLKLQIEVKALIEEHQIRLNEVNTSAMEAEAKRQASENKLAAERIDLQGKAVEIAAKLEKAQLDLQTARQEAANAQKNEETVKSVNQTVSQVSKELAALKKEVSDTKMAATEAKVSASNAERAANAPKRKPKGIKPKKDGKKTTALTIAYDDGTEEDVTVS